MLQAHMILLVPKAFVYNTRVLHVHQRARQTGNRKTDHTYTLRSRETQLKLNSRKNRTFDGLTRHEHYMNPITSVVLCNGKGIKAKLPHWCYTSTAPTCHTQSDVGAAFPLH